ncbi:MAG: ATP-binding protein [Synergistaceae bacterium]|nr:ATP-binding protein [Synergistaceae bacterium]
MKVITEAMLRDELKRSEITEYRVPEGMMLSPAAREYLQQRKIKISLESASERQREAAAPAERTPEMAAPLQAKYRDYETGALYLVKPEYMTQIEGDMLVVKNHPRIAFRGKLDSLQALIVLDQAILNEKTGYGKMIADLDDILGVLREIMRCDALNEPMRVEKIIGLTSAELRERSHAPMKFFHVKYMRLPDYKMGIAYALLNQLRTAVREAEVTAVNAFKNGTNYERQDILEIFNRLSSAVHIMMCTYLQENNI